MIKLKCPRLMMYMKCFSLFFFLQWWFIFCWRDISDLHIYCRCGIFYDCFYTFGALWVKFDMLWSFSHFFMTNLFQIGEATQSNATRGGKIFWRKNCSQAYSTISKILLVPTPTDSFIDSYIVWKDHLSKNDRNLEYFGRLTTWNC